MTGPGGIFPEDSFGLTLPGERRDKFYACCRGAAEVFGAWQADTERDGTLLAEKAA